MYVLFGQVNKNLNREKSEYQLSNFEKLWKSDQPKRIVILHYHGIKEAVCHRQKVDLETENKGWKNGHISANFFGGLWKINPGADTVV